VSKGREEACKTFVEQTKQLITLASAFIFAPAAVQIVLQLASWYWLIFAEGFFIVSVLAGYVALASIAGSQHKGEFDVHNANAKWSGLIQFFAYVIGLVIFLIWFQTQPPKPRVDGATMEPPPPVTNTPPPSGTPTPTPTPMPTPTPTPTPESTKMPEPEAKPPTPPQAEGRRPRVARRRGSRRCRCR
jgi:uncharacterized iron-regulated membrane protein